MSRKLTEKPAGRQPIQTVTLPLERLGELVERMRRAIAEGQKIYWICPLVEESEEIKLMSAEDRFAMLTADLRRRGRPGPRPHERPRQGRGDARLQGRRDAHPGRHDGHRGRRRRARRDDHGDRACRALRAGAVAPAARPRRARRQAVDLRAALQVAARRNREAAAVGDARDGGRLPASPRKI